mmetsp:Transcript_14951/g.30031  ORF Transcript_14951/g.30031 Transcript_14951/m.30031 type:complete len:970 (-) Transcript_14951:227-3136(-)
MITSAARRAASGARRAKEIRARTAETASIISGHSGAPPSVRASSTKARSSGAKFQVLWPSPPVSPPLVLRGSGTLRGYESLRIWDEDGFLLSGGKRGGHGGPSRNRGAGNNYRNGNGKKSRPPFQSINGRSFSTKAAPQADGDGDEKEKTGTLIDKTRVPPSPSASPPSTPSSSSSTAATATATKAASPSSSLSTSARLRQKLMLADLQTPPSTQSKLSALLRSLPGTLLSGLSAFRVWCVQFSKELAADPKRKLSELRHAFVEEAKHYWVGSKLLWADVKITTEILLNMAFGNRLTRRERKQLVRTTTDLLRLVPMSVFVLVPFMEIFLPLALKVFPNMLPSTFEDSLKKEESMKKELKMRLAMAGFMKDMLREMAKDVKTHKDDEGHSAREVTNFVAKAKRGSVDNDDIFKFAKLFKDDLTLDNLSRTQLVTMCTFMSLPPYGADAFMRYNLRAALRDIQNDDQRILFEGLESLNRSELQEASRERGMRALGLSKDELRLQLQEWLNLSCNQQVPISLLILSRSFALSRGSGSSQGRDTSISGGAGGGGGSVSQTSSEQSKQSSLATDLAQSISSLDYEIVNEVVLDVATPEERRSKEIRSLKLEAYEHQAELIADEKEEHDRDMEAMKAKVAKQERTGQAALTAGGTGDDAGAAETATTEADPATAAAAAIAVSGDEETKQEDEEVKQGEGKKTTATTKEASAVLGDFSLEKTDEVGPSMAAALAGGAELQDKLQLQDEKLDGAEPSPAEGDEAAAAAAAAAGAEEANGANGGDSNGEDEDEDELGVEDLEALATFASLSAVDDEKLFCEKIKKEVEDMHLSEDVKDGHDVTAAGDAAATAAAAAWKEAEKESSSGVVNTDDLAEKVRADFGIATEGGGGGGGGDNSAATKLLVLSERGGRAVELAVQQLQAHPAYEDNIHPLVRQVIDSSAFFCGGDGGGGWKSEHRDLEGGGRGGYFFLSASPV